ncbi:hypothetical protein D3C85_1424830 [compost metagenome]
MGGCADGFGNQLDVVDGDVALAALQCANEGPVQSGLGGHALLRHARVNAHQADIAGKHQAKRKRDGTRHALDARKTRCLKPRCLKPFNIQMQTTKSSSDARDRARPCPVGSVLIKKEIQTRL